MKEFISGGDGYIGPHFAKKCFHLDSFYEVKIYKNFSSYTLENLAEIDSQKLKIDNSSHYFRV